MPSPFPGMNPYLEQEDAWHDFHESFMPHVHDLISAQVDPRYIVKIDEHVYIERLAFVEIRDHRNRQLVTRERRTRTRNWTCRKCCTTSTTRRITKPTSTRARPTRR